MKKKALLFTFFVLFLSSVSIAGSRFVEVSHAPSNLPYWSDFDDASAEIANGISISYSLKTFAYSISGYPCNAQAWFSSPYGTIDHSSSSDDGNDGIQRDSRNGNVTSMGGEYTISVSASDYGGAIVKAEASMSW